jgi:putative DNA primase/helicase
MSQQIRFGTHGPALHAGGWPVIPIQEGSKAPRIKGWDAGFNKAQITAFSANDYAHGNIGLLARTFPGIDIDVVDEECAAAIEQHALRTLGPAPVRLSGAGPKRLLMYTTSAPFAKLKVYLSGPSGESGPDAKRYAVEVLGDGQQYLIYGKHPSGSEYNWPHNNGPQTHDVWDLTSIEQSDVQRFLLQLPECLPKGWRVVSNAGDAGASVGGASLAGVSSVADGAGSLAVFENYRGPLEGWSLKRVIDEVLVHLDPDMPYDEWLNVGMALHHQGAGDQEWLSAYEGWSARGTKWAEGVCQAKWKSFSQQRSQGNGALTLASLIKKTRAAFTASASSTRNSLSARIDATEDFDELTKATLKAVFEADLPESDTSLLIKKIAQKTKVPVKSLTKDGAIYRRIGASSQMMHLNAAKEVIKMLGKENIIFAQGRFWLWGESGVWKPMDDRELKEIIHKVAQGPMLTSSVVNSILDMVKTETNRDDVNFDQRRDSINCINGDLHYLGFLGAWVLQPHVREHYQTAQIPIIYNPGARAPRFEKYLSEVFAGDPDAEQKKLVVQEALGYTLLSSCHLEKFFLLLGNGANGKSVLVAVVAALVGPKLVTAVQPSQFNSAFQRAHLQGKLANIVTEIAQGAEIADDKLKSLVSGELTTAEVKFKDPFDFNPIATHWFATNHLPRTRDFSGALFRRAMTLSFNNRFEGSRRDVGLTKKLLAELPGILNIALLGLARLLENGHFTDCPSSDLIKKDWRLESDQISQFIEELCIWAPDGQVSSAQLFNAYLGWARVSGINRTVSRNTFSTRLQGLGFAIHKGTKGERQIKGLKMC